MNASMRSSLEDRPSNTWSSKSRARAIGICTGFPSLSRVAMAISVKFLRLTRVAVDLRWGLFDGLVQ